MSSFSRPNAAAGEQPRLIGGLRSELWQRADPSVETAEDCWGLPMPPYPEGPFQTQPVSSISRDIRRDRPPIARLTWAHHSCPRTEVGWLTPMVRYQGYACHRWRLDRSRIVPSTLPMHD